MVFSTEDADEVAIVKQEGFEVNVHVLVRQMLPRLQSLGTEGEHIGLIGDRVAMRFLGPA
jgi:hypothetical protein